jgi:hypothetical protein
MLNKHPDQHALIARVSRPRSSKAGKPFVCPLDVCSSGYTRRHDLHRHMHRKHGMIDSSEYDRILRKKRKLAGAHGEYEKWRIGLTIPLPAPWMNK